ncbi:hypothetical protein B0H12DRAFT_1068719 [Mycena haematopus]|nr:hypothetical protein B0H12DRAFT_1068719 [Mycena haematopus]
MSTEPTTEQQSPQPSPEAPAATGDVLPPPDPDLPPPEADVLRPRVDAQVPTPRVDILPPRVDDAPPPPPRVGDVVPVSPTRDDAPVPPTPPAPPAHDDAPPLGSLISENGEVYSRPPQPAIVRREKEQRTRRKNGEPVGKRGKVSWVWGTKLRFLESRKDAWVAATQQKTVGEFYTRIAKLYVVKYGMDLKDDEDFACDVADPPDWVANKVVNERLSVEETKARQDFHTKLRERQRLGGWYRSQYTSLLKEDKATFHDLFARLGEGGRKPPRRPQLMHFYSEKCYDAHIKSRVDERKKALQQRAEFTGTPAPAAIAIQNEVTKECWEEESEEFKLELLREREREHNILLKAWEESMADGPNRTPEEFSASLKSAAHYLQPFVDAIADRYGMCVSILMAGPIGDNGGRIEMRSVHSGKTRGLVEKDWPLHDPEGFTQVQKSMVDFGHHVFSQAERDARVTRVQGPADDSSRGPAAAAAAAGAPTGTGAAVAPAATAAGTGAAAGGAAAAAAPAAADAADTDENGEGAGAGAERVLDEEGEGGRGETDEDAAVLAQVEKLWKRRDASKWSEELARAHRGFERGKSWGVDWASLVKNFYDFEAAWGYTDAGGQITTSDRPKALEWWLGRGRKWEKTVDVGVLDPKKPGTFVANWWDWWVRIQPSDRSDWSPMLRLHGKNGMLQVMASLLWWGEAVGENPAELREWSMAVEDVDDAFTQMLRPGVIAKFRGEAGKDDAKRGTKRKAAEGKDAAERENGTRRGRASRPNLTVLKWERHRRERE